MPVIKKSFIARERTFASFNYVVKCDAAGDFTIALPNEMARWMGKKEMEAKSLEAVENAFRAKFKEWDKSSKTTRRVIKIFVDHGDQFHRPGFSLGLAAATFNETTYTHEGKERKEYDQDQQPGEEGSTTRARWKLLQEGVNHGTHHQGWRVVPWTQQTEDFLLHLAGEVTRLADAVDAITADVEGWAARHANRPIALGGGAEQLNITDSPETLRACFAEGQRHFSGQVPMTEHPQGYSETEAAAWRQGWWAAKQAKDALLADMDTAAREAGTP